MFTTWIRFQIWKHKKFKIILYLLKEPMFPWHGYFSNLIIQKFEKMMWTFWSPNRALEQKKNYSIIYIYIYIYINYNQFWISNVSPAIYGWNPFKLIQRLKSFFFLSKNITSFLLKMWNSHKLLFNGQKTLNLSIFFINWIIF